MNRKIFHDSTRAAYRSQPGAAVTGASVHLRLAAPESGITAVKACFCGSEAQFEEPMESDSGWWSCTVTMPHTPGVLWYHFALRAGDELFYYGAPCGEPCGLGEIYTDRPVGFQLTVYNANFETPDFYKNAIMYQIFPDRFARGGDIIPAAEYHRAMGRDVVLHKSWEEPVLYTPLPGRSDYAPCDYYGGTLRGIIQKLDYIASLGVGAIYLNPIFEAASNHRYNTADYLSIDPMLGTAEDLRELCAAAAERGMRIILDGVFSHTGADSIYFNRTGAYPEPGAYGSQQSRFYQWYKFSNWPDDYSCWWNFRSLPEVDEENADWRDFMISGENSVMKTWLREGVGGWRLDVADELPDDAIEAMRAAVKGESAENLLLGEVWEDATTKQSYGLLRRYALGGALDSVMNYPLRSAITDCLTGAVNVPAMIKRLLTQCCVYPKPMYYCLMNLLSSHDVERIRTVMATGQTDCRLSREEQATLAIPYQEDVRAALLQKIAAAIVFSLPGMPSVYYGDETGMHGMKDPFNRAPFCTRDTGMLTFYKKLADIRNGAAAMRTGHVTFFALSADIGGIVRFILDGHDAFRAPAQNGCFITVFNRGASSRSPVLDIYSLSDALTAEQASLLHEADFNTAACLLTGDTAAVKDGLIQIDASAMSVKIFELKKQ